MTSNKSKDSRVILDIKYPYEKSWDKERNFVEIEIDNCDTSVMNSIRRTIISEVPTISIKTTPHDETQVEVFQNDTPLHNQFLGHRLGMIPFNISNVDEFDVNDYELIIDEENETDFPKHITTEHIKIRRISNDKILSEVDKKRILPPDSKTGDYHLITILKPKYYQRNYDMNSIDSFGVEKTKLKLYVKCKLYKGRGSENGKFNPTSCCCYFNKVDEEKANVGLQKFIIQENKMIEENNLTKISLENLERKFNTSQKDRYFYTDKFGEPNKFVFRIESIGNIGPLVILYRGIKELKFNITNFKTNCLKLNTNVVEFEPSKNLPNGFDILVHGEDDTLGNIIQSYCNKLFCDYSQIESQKLKYVGYVKVHPLKRQIILSIQPLGKMEPENIVKEFIIPTCDTIIKKLNKLSSDLEDSGLLSKELKRNIFN